MQRWFRKGLSPHQTALAMIGAKPAHHVAIIGARDPGLAAEVALVTGLNGQTTVIDDEEGAAERVAISAQRAGALVEFERAATSALRLASGSQDIAVVMARLGALPDMQRKNVVDEALRVLRPGGRVIVIEGAKRAGLLGGAADKAPRLPADEVLALLDRRDARARRQLADVDGVAFYEARRE